jgi:hypothetical protein
VTVVEAQTELQYIGTEGWDSGSFRTEIAIRAGVLGVRDARPEDLDGFQRYWHQSGDRIKELLRIDLTRLGTPDDTRARFLRMIRVPGSDQRSIVFTLTLNGMAIGYTNVNMHGPDENYPHFHTYMHTDREVMRAIAAASPRREGGRGAGVAAVMIGLGVGTLLRNMPRIRRVCLQTRVTSEGINKALDLYLPPAETRHFDNPDGIASPGEFHIRYVHRSDAAAFMERAKLLARGE